MPVWNFGVYDWLIIMLPIKVQKHTKVRTLDGKNMKYNPIKVFYAEETKN